METLIPQLAESIDPTKLATYVASDRWEFEQKVDGDRRLVYVHDGTVTPLSRDGTVTILPQPVAAVFAALRDGRWAFDGELLGTTLVVFDLVNDGLDVIGTSSPFYQRRAALEGLFGLWRPPPCVRLLPHATDPDAKLALVRRVLAANAEGVMVKDVDAPYEPGPHRSRRTLKAKFRHDIDCVVDDLRIGGKENMSLVVYRDGEKVPIGECGALTGDGPSVQVGDVVTVRYTYCTDDDRLFQPTLPRRRTDKRPEECTFDQLVYTNKEIIE